MKKTFTLVLGLIFSINNLYSQNAIDVTDQTIKIGAFEKEELMFGFAAGDKIIFTFQETNKKELKEIEVLEYPANSKFSEYKSTQVEKSFQVSKQGVYIFRFKNAALGGRVCKIRIQRIPSSETTLNFNTTVNWVTRQDTTWNTYTKEVIIGYDSAYVQKTKKELVKADTIVNMLFDKQLRVHSETAFGKTPYEYADVQLPQNTYFPNRFNPYNTTEVVAWSYWLGVDQKSLEEYEKANKNLATGIKVVGALTGYGALATLAATGVSLFGTNTVGDNVRYKFYGIVNNQELLIDHGNVVTASGRNTQITQGAFRVQLYNDNIREGINVTLKMVVLQVSKTWENKSYTELIVTPRTEKQMFREPVISTNRVAVAGL